MQRLNFFTTNLFLLLKVQSNETSKVFKTSEVLALNQNYLNFLSKPFLFYCLAFLLLVLSSCTPDDQQQFIFIGHAYDWKAEQGNRVDPRIAELDLSPYEQIWLGGDICSRTSEDQATLDYLDQLFKISSPTTHWALGNHDINKGDKNRIAQKTKRPSYYIAQHDAISILVLDTNWGHPQIKVQDDSLTRCTQINQQYQLLKTLADTISQSKYLVVLHHHALLTNELADNQIKVGDVFHYVLTALPFSCTPSGNFQELAYPLLKQVQNKGIQVILIGGDFGQRAKRFEFQNKDGIWFLGSGINNSMDPKYQPDYVTNLNPDSILIFDYNTKLKELYWRFEPLGKDFEN